MKREVGSFSQTFIDPDFYCIQSHCPLLVRIQILHFAVSMDKTLIARNSNLAASLKKNSVLGSGFGPAVGVPLNKCFNAFY